MAHADYKLGLETDLTKGRKLRIAIVSDFTVLNFYGGGEGRYFEIARRLVALGHDVTMLSMRPLEAPRTVHRDGVKFLFFGPKVKAPPKRTLWNLVGFMLSVLWHLLIERYDIVDAQPYSPLPAVFLARLYTGVPLVATLHDVTNNAAIEFFQQSTVAAALEQLFYRLPYDHIVTVSNYTRSQLEQHFGIAPNKVSVVYNGANPLTDMERSSIKIRDLIFVGRLVKHKNIEQFLRLCKELDCSGAIIGTGPLRGEIEEMTHSIRNVEFLGAIPDHSVVMTEIASSRLLLLPSTREGFGIVLAEAGAAGIPSVAYASGGVTEVIIDGQTGYLVMPGDFEALKKRSEDALAEGENGRLGKNAYAHVSTSFTWERTVAELELIYLEVLLKTGNQARSEHAVKVS
jgi:glycosyltransferase involved in cell wall biosynthesis